MKTGDDLRFAIETATAERPALVEDFLYERQVLMLAGEPGVGKSIVSTTLALALTSQSRLWSFLTIPTPRQVFYLQLEGTEEESYERIRRMAPVLPCNTEKLCWHYRSGLNLLEALQTESLLKQIAQWGKHPDLVIIDPLYQTVFGELSKELPSKAILRFLDAAKQAFAPCAFLLVHHTKKSSYASSGQKIEEDDPFYGSQWLKAYVDISYYLKPGGGRYADQVMLVNKKARGGDVVKDLILHYEPETDTVTTDVPLSEQSGYERVSKYLESLKQVGKTTTYFEVMDACKLSSRQLRNVQMALFRAEKLRCDKFMGKKKIWEPL